MSHSETQRDRIIELDALRGLAVIGIVWMNVYVFALPTQAYYNPISWGGESQLDFNLWWFSYVFIEDKFRTLFAMMFGAGAAILIERSDQRPVRAHLARMMILFAIGMVHATLIANNDILRGYAMAGVLLTGFVWLSARTISIIAVGVVLLHVILGSFWVAAQQPSYWEFNFGTDPFALEVAASRGDETFMERAARRYSIIPRTLSVISVSIPINLATMMVGVAAWKSGLLAGKWRIRSLLILASVCAFPSAFALMYYASQAVASGYDGHIIATNAFISSAILDLALGLGYAAAAMALFQFARDSRAVNVLASTGRLSLTNYLMTGIILSVIYASWGLGLFGELSRAEVFLTSFVPIIAMLIWSPIWAARMGQGPFERLWRGASKVLS